MATIRHVLNDNHWEIQCPACRQFVPIDVAVMNGRARFPQHKRWAPSWAHLFTERFPRFAIWFPVARVLMARKAIEFEVSIRRRAWWEPICSYREAYNWRAEMPPTGVSALGPLEA